MDCTDDLQTTHGSEDEEECQRILKLQDLIEQNIQLEQEIESRSFGESMSSICDILGRANDVVKGYEDRKTNSTEFLLDAELLSRNHKVAEKAIQYNTNITDRMFCDAINNTVFKDNRHDWDALCSLACGCAVPVFTNASMLPFINVEIKQRAPKQRAQRRTITAAEEKRPTKSKKLERRDDGSNAVNHILKQIKNIYRSGNNQPIPYFKLICNPSNFMDTVQNALNVSFLIKENMIVMEMGKDGLPQVRVNSGDQDMSAVDRYQTICNLDAKICEKYIRKYKIKEPLLNRTETDEK